MVVRWDQGFDLEFVVYDIFNGQYYQINRDIFASLWAVSDESYCSAFQNIGSANIEKLLKLGFITKKYSTNKPKIHPEIKTDVPVVYYPREAEIHLTSYCNLSCLHCVYEIKRIRDTKYLETEKLFNLFDEMEEMGILRIVISGGEPLIRHDISRIIQNLQNRRFRIEILTNATLITHKLAQLLSHRHFSINYSIDGHDARTCDFLRGDGSFEMIIRGVRILNEHSVNHNAVCVIHKKNFKSAEKIIALTEKLKSKSVNFIFLDLIGRAQSNLSDMALTKQEIHRFIDRIVKIKASIPVNFLDPAEITGDESDGENIYCSGGTYRCAINHLGEVYPCVYGFNSKKFLMGDLQKATLGSIWRRKKWYLFRGGVKESDLKTCAQCVYSQQCALKRCRLRPYFKTKDFYGPYPDCPFSLKS